MAQVEFKGSATSIAFDPLRAPDQTPQMREQLREQVGAMRENNDSVIQNRRQIASGMAEQERSQAVTRERNLGELARFSKTLTDMVLEEQGRRNDRDWDEGFNTYYAGGGDPKALEQFDRGLSELNQAEIVVNQTAYKAALAGEPDQAVRAIRNLSGAKRVGYLTALAQDKGAGYESWLMNLIQTDKETKIKLGDREVTPMDALKDQAILAGVSTWARTHYMRINGLNEASMPMLARYVMPQMRQAESKIVAGISSQIRSAQAEQERDETLSVLVSDVAAGRGGQSFNAAVTRLQSVINPETGTLYTTGGAVKYILGEVTKIAADGRQSPITIPMLEELLNSPDLDGDPNRTWAKRYPALVAGLLDRAQNGLREDIQREEAQQDDAEKAWIQGILTEANKVGGLSDAALEAAKTFHEQNFVGRPFPAALADRRTIEDKNDEVMDQYFAEQLARGYVPSESDFDRASAEIVNKWRPQFERLKADIVENPDAKQDLESLYRYLAESIGPVDINAPKNPTIPLAEAEVQRMYLSEYNKFLVGSNPAAARSQAFNRVQEEILRGRASTQGGSGSGKFLVDPVKSKGFVNVIPGGMTEQQKVAALSQMRYAQSVASGGITAVRRNAKQLAPPAVLDDIEDLARNPRGPRPAIVTYLTQELNRLGKRVSEWDVMDQLLDGAGRPTLPRSRADQEAKAQLSPALLAAINTFPSTRRTQRALTGMAWSPTKVPNGWGALIEQHAKANGIEPALLAGLLAAESSWNPRNRSKSGAKGLAQLMDPTARELGVTNPDDPKQAIPAAARYLRQKIDDFGGDIRLGLRAYNQGTAGTQRSPNGASREAREYPDKVLRYASTYGWGQQAQPFNNPQLMNPRLVRAASRTFDSGQPGLDLWFENRQFPAVLPGRVKEVGTQGRGRGASGQGYGNYIVVESIDPASGQPVDVLYAHLDAINVKEGQTLREGQVLGKQGGTGRVVSQDGTIASIDFFAPAPKGSKSMTPFSNYQRLRQDISRRWYGS